MFPRRTLALIVLLASTLPALVLASGCACNRVGTMHACCCSAGGVLSVSAPRGCCPRVAQTTKDLTSDLTYRSLAPSRPDAARFIIWAWRPPSALVSFQSTAPTSASETPPDLYLRNCVLLV